MVGIQIEQLDLLVELFIALMQIAALCDIFKRPEPKPLLRAWFELPPIKKDIVARRSRNFVKFAKGILVESFCSLNVWRSLNSSKLLSV
ncbi:hypothetical protein CEXT_620371 [Caerostris extrusa]|uniref:Uncharacterized protein n=1 Tax=Caerostris extrusa TaxID=172846 RepID=A0AAV4P3S2_CAEEX|nr:hypothetical protein CEXT_620371 [Caerostris extrusa]